MRSFATLLQEAKKPSGIGGRACLEIADGIRQRAQLIVGKIHELEGRQVADRSWQGGELVLLENQPRQIGESARA